MYQLYRSADVIVKVAVVRAPTEWAIMKYPEESWISNSKDAGELGDELFGGGSEEVGGPTKVVDGHQEQGSTIIRGLLWAVMVLILMAIVRMYISTCGIFMFFLMTRYLTCCPPKCTSKPCVSKTPTFS